VFANNTPDVGRGFGRAQMESHGNLILRLYGEARGRAAEYWGEEYLASDRWVRLNGVTERAARWYGKLTRPFRAYLDAFARGLNDYAEAHPQALSQELKVVLPLTSEDVLAHVQRVIYFGFIASDRVIGTALADKTAAISNQTTIPVAGSNAWAVAPSRSSSGKALLLVNPHLPWSGYYTLYEAQLVGPGLDVYGVTLVGFPVIGIGFNDELGWTHTVNPIDAADLYELQSAGNGYLFDGHIRTFNEKREFIKVRARDGSMKTHVENVKSSVQGVIVGERRGRPIALRVAGIEEPGICEQWWEMARSRNLKEFQRAARRLQLPLFTIIYADRGGHILSVFNGHVPERPAGNYDWNGVVSGSSKKTLWTSIHPYESLPRVIDPPAGWLQNSNDPPWTTTFPLALNRLAFPAYMAPSGMSFRAERSARLLSEDTSWSLDELVAAKYSTRLELADRILDEVIAAARQEAINKEANNNDLLTEAADVLTRWDRQTEADSRGAVLFERFVRVWNQSGGGFQDPWREDAPLTTPAHLADARKTVAALRAAAEWVKGTYGSLNIPWGAIHRLRRDGVDLPANGIAGDLFGSVRVVGFAPSSNGQRVANLGDSFIAAIEFSTPVKALALLGYGNASQPLSRHRTDQLEFVSRKELRPVWRTRAEILAHLERQDQF
jgi:acyl-homoserine-lactone acylase